jgi:hypothetical protein
LYFYVPSEYANRSDPLQNRANDAIKALFSTGYSQFLWKREIAKPIPTPHPLQGEE